MKENLAFFLTSGGHTVKIGLRGKPLRFDVHKILNAALSDLRTQRRRQKAEYQGAPFADVFLVSLILSDEDSERACIVDVGDTGMSYVIPWSSIPKDLQEPLHRYVSEAEGRLCGYCKEELCNSESGRMVVELYLGKQDGHGFRILY